VTKCVLMMVEKEFRNHKWARAKKMMAKVDRFLTKLQTYDANTMDEKLIDKLKPIVTDPSLSSKSMMAKSVAAANLWDWVTNIYAYNRIYVKVVPLMNRLQAAQKAKQAANEKLASVTHLVQKVQNQLQQLQDSFIAATNEKAQVEAEAAACMERLALANRLIQGLASEKTRWGQLVKVLRVSKKNLVGDCLLSAAFTSYIGGFDADNRKDLWNGQWVEDLVQREIPLSNNVDPLPLLASDGQQTQMMAEGLPADRISLENGAIMTSCKRWPLVIDPQLQGIKWLRNRFDDPKYNLGVIQQNNKNFLHVLKCAVSEGHVLIIENIGEEIDPMLNPVLACAAFKNGRNWFLKVGEENIEFDRENFKLFLITKLANPDYKPEIQAQTTLINFIATEAGLTDQLLARVVSEERADLEQQKQALTDQFTRFKLQLIGLEDELLERLANAPEDILSDVALIEGLELTKRTA